MTVLTAWAGKPIVPVEFQKAPTYPTASSEASGTTIQNVRRWRQNKMTANRTNARTRATTAARRCEYTYTYRTGTEPRTNHHRTPVGEPRTTSRAIMANSKRFMPMLEPCSVSDSRPSRSAGVSWSNDRRDTTDCTTMAARTPYMRLR